MTDGMQSNSNVVALSKSSLIKKLLDLWIQSFTPFSVKSCMCQEVLAIFIHACDRQKCSASPTCSAPACPFCSLWWVLCWEWTASARSMWPTSRRASAWLTSSGCCKTAGILSSSPRCAPTRRYAARWKQMQGWAPCGPP